MGVSCELMSRLPEIEHRFPGRPASSIVTTDWPTPSPIGL